MHKNAYEKAQKLQIYERRKNMIFNVFCSILCIFWRVSNKNNIHLKGSAKLRKGKCLYSFFDIVVTRNAFISHTAVFYNEQQKYVNAISA